jgi:formyltetrahydrofolate deformylase
MNPATSTTAPPGPAPTDAASSRPSTVRLLIQCVDRPGIVAAVSRFLAEAGANIVESAQHSADADGGARFYMRIEFDPGARNLETLEPDFQHAVAGHFDMTWSMWSSGKPKRMALLCSKYDHCVLDLLWRWRNGELHADIPMVISNHDDLRDRVEAFGVEYVHVPVSKDGKEAAYAEMVDLLRDRVDMAVLARYMQILTDEFLAAVGVPVINIHHSFLPAFVGANPYARAHERGVKLIGATAHYVTPELDAGPIIEQDVERVSHEENAIELEQIGRDIERVVLARGVARHLNDRILVHENRTIVF